MRNLFDSVSGKETEPFNFYSVTAIFKRFMERLVVYAYWPWRSHAPKLRRKKATKRAILIGSIFIGLMSQQERPTLSDKTQDRVRTMVRKLTGYSNN